MHKNPFNPMNSPDNKENDDKPKYYVYGGMYKGQNTKLHICDEHARVFCGNKSQWMEASDLEIADDGYIDGYFDLITNLDFVCKRCLNKWLKLKNDN